MRVLVLGATSAIAQAAARIWAARGDELVLVARSAEKLQAVADDLRTRGGKVETIVHDLNDRVFVAPPADVVLLAHGVLTGPDTLQTNLVGPIDIEKIREHLDDCGPCLEQYDLDVVLKALVRRSCGCESAPIELRERILVTISRARAQLSS